MKTKYFNDAIIGNRNVKATFSKKGELLRLYYPNIDYRQFIDEFIVGVKINDSRLINLYDDINNIYKCGKISYEFRKIFGNKEKIYIFYCDKGAMSLVICEKMSGLGYICKTVVGGFEAYKGMCVIN